MTKPYKITRFLFELVGVISVDRKLPRGNKFITIVLVTNSFIIITVSPYT